jgi:LPXTG-motif cell wall-anchored protein
MIRRYIVAAALVAISPLAAAAQFTAVITPPEKDKAAVVASAPAAARADSQQKAKLTDMKLWVDSAASALTARDTTTRTDTAAKILPAPVAQAPAPVKHAHVSTGDSAALPDTASPLPAVALLGLTMIVSGLLLLGKRRA